MKKWIALLSILCLSMFSFSQGINFETGSWAEVVAKAKQANKLIYLDVYAEWCGPCKMMSRDVFPNEDAGKKYNELFINYKIDAEKGEGRTVAAKYAVSSYPTNLYIDPKTENVVYRIAGACDVPEFLRRADIAQLDFKDPMSWEDYKKKLKSNPKDLAFLQQYIEKGGRTGNYTDDAIDMYVKHHLQKPVSDSNLIFLINHTMTVDNQGYKVLLENAQRADAMIPDARYRISEREKNFWLQNTFKKALALKDIEVLKSIKPIINKFNKHDSIGSWYNVEKQFYQALKDEPKMKAASLKAAQYYYKISASQMAQKDAAILEDNMATLRKDLSLRNYNEDKIQEQIAQQKKNQPQFAHGFSTNAANLLLTAASETNIAAQATKKEIQEAIKYMDKVQEIVPVSHPAWIKSVEMKATLYKKNNENAAALKYLEQLKTMKDMPQPLITSIDSLISKFKS